MIDEKLINLIEKIISHRIYGHSNWRWGGWNQKFRRHPRFRFAKLHEGRPLAPSHSGWLKTNPGHPGYPVHFKNSLSWYCCMLYKVSKIRRLHFTATRWLIQLIHSVLLYDGSSNILKPFKKSSKSLKYSTDSRKWVTPGSVEVMWRGRRLKLRNLEEHNLSWKEWQCFI